MGKTAAVTGARRPKSGLAYDGGSEEAEDIAALSVVAPALSARARQLLMLRPLVPNAGHLEEHASTLWRDLVGQVQALACELSIQLSTRHSLWSPPLATQPMFRQITPGMAGLHKIASADASLTVCRENAANLGNF
jgi:hypothetical protein